MCLPAVPALLAAGTALSAGSSIMGGYQQAAQAKFQAAQAQQNAPLAAAQAAQTQAQGEQDALNQQRKIDAVKGAQTLGFASQGLDVSFGTPLDVISGTAQLGAEDVQRIRQNTQDRVQSLTIDADNLNDTAALDKVAGQNAITNGWLRAGGTVLSGASQIGSKGGLNFGGGSGGSSGATDLWHGGMA